MTELLNQLNAIAASAGGIAFFGTWWYMIATWLGGSGGLLNWALGMLPIPTLY